MAVPQAVKKQAEEAERIQKELIAKRSGEPLDDGTGNPTPQGPDDWEKRYKGMQKAFDKTVSGLKNENEGLASEVAELKALVEKSLTEAPAAQKPVFSEEEIKEYGQDFLDMVARVGSTNGHQPGSDIEGELSDLKDRFDGIVQTQFKSDEDKFYIELEQAVPNWEEINEQDGFKNWLSEFMPLTNKQRQTFLEEAHKRFDAPAVIGFFKSWLGGSSESYSPDTRTSSSEMGMEPVNTDIITRRDIAIFYDELKLGKWKGREEEARKNELKIFKAQKEGRVR